MKAFISVYRQPVPSESAIAATRTETSDDLVAQKFLEEYGAERSFYDWGDDPTFFAAEKVLGTSARASWGVCRANVRKQLSVGDFVVFFCGRQNRTLPKEWNYYLIGCATVKKLISRRQLWTDDEFAEYRRFYNVLAYWENGTLVQRETLHKFRDDWRKRAHAPYVIFDPDNSKTKINVDTPLHVATKQPDESTEQWFSNDMRVREVEKVLFGDTGIARRLRSRHPKISHPHIAIHNGAAFVGGSTVEKLSKIRESLLPLI